MKLQKGSYMSKFDWASDYLELKQKQFEYCESDVLKNRTQFLLELIKEYSEWGLIGSEISQRNEKEITIIITMDTYIRSKEYKGFEVDLIPYLLISSEDYFFETRKDKTVLNCIVPLMEEIKIHDYSKELEEIKRDNRGRE